MLQAIDANYDFIIIDTAPLLAVTDASLIGRMADTSIMIVRYDSVQKQVAQRSVDLLDRSGAHLLGVVVNAVDHNASEYTDYYGGKYHDYYSERNSE